MNVEQASNLAGHAAAAITPAQMAVLNSNVRLAINNAKSEDLRNGAAGELSLIEIILEASHISF